MDAFFLRFSSRKEGEVDDDNYDLYEFAVYGGGKEKEISRFITTT